MFHLLKKTTIMYFIDYKGKKYPARDIDNVPTFEDEGTVTVAEYALWEDMENDYDNEDKEAHAIDNEIFFYVENGFLTKNPSDDELKNYIAKNI